MGEVLDYATPPAQSNRFALMWGIASCVVGFMGNVVGMLAAHALRQMPPGNPAVAIGLLLLMVCVIHGTALVGLPLGIIGIIQGRRRTMAWMIGLLGTVLSVLPQRLFVMW